MSRSAIFALALALLAAPAAAQESDLGQGRYAVTLHGVDRHPGNVAAARATLARIEEAALDVCGASRFSLREVRLAERGSACWHDSVADAVRQIADPLVAEAWKDPRQTLGAR